MNGGRHDDSVEKVVARHGENIEMVIVPKMERDIDVEHGNCAWMALNVPPAPPLVVAAAAVFIVVGCYALPPLTLLFAVLKQ